MEALYAVWAVLLLASASASKDAAKFARKMDGASARGLGKEKWTHLHFYWHDITSGPNQTVWTIIPAEDSSKVAFGLVRMADNPLTIGREPSSKVVGRSQGMYGQASRTDVRLLMEMNYIFTEGMYNGSSICVGGSNRILSQGRELAVIGGTGVFRFARGYAILRTLALNLQTGDAIVEYNVYLMHF